MNRPEVHHLYVYKPANIYTVSIFARMLLWAAKPSHFNDPFDCSLNINNDMSAELFLEAICKHHGPRCNWTEEIKSWVEKVVDESNQLRPTSKSNFEWLLHDIVSKHGNKGVVCLSETPENILMWAHYAENHKGMCIEFERSPSNVLGDDLQCCPIDYCEDYPMLNLSELLHNRDYEAVHLLLRQKSAHWSYEKEWRLFTATGDMYCPLPGKIVRVVFGAKASHTFMEIINKLCMPHNIPSVQARLSPNTFAILIPDS